MYLKDDFNWLNRTIIEYLESLWFEWNLIDHLKSKSIK